MDDSYDEGAALQGSEQCSVGDNFGDVDSPAEDREHEYSGNYEDFCPPLPDNRGITYGEFKPRKKLSSFWKRPATKVYLDNFGFSVNGYQPMIDYLDARDSGLIIHGESVHLPYLEERCLNKYSADKPFRLYTNSDIDTLIDKGEKIITQIRQNDAAGASNVHRRTHTNWSMTKKYVQLVKNSYVVDYRNLHSDSNSPKTDSKVSLGGLIKEEPKYCVDLPRFVPDMESSSLVGTYIMSKNDHAQQMADRRDRLKVLDDQYEESIDKLSMTVEKMNRRANKSVTKVISPEGNIYSTDEVQLVTDEALTRNRIRRQQDLDRMCDEVDEISAHRYRPRNSVQFLGDEVSGVNAMALALARKNAIDAADARETAENFRAQRNFYGSSDRAVGEKICDLRSQSRKLAILDEMPFETPRRRAVVVHEDVISPVQDRIMNRAREMCGNTSEIRRINNRAKFVNTITPRPKTGDTGLMLPPTKMERNVVHMARSLAHGGNSVRKFDIDDEIDNSRNPLSTFMIKTYCTREYDKPVPQITSDSHGVRQAITRARERNTLLGH